MTIWFSTQDDDKTLWIPAQTVGELYISQIRSVEGIYGVHSGISDIVFDEVSIDTSQLHYFLQEVLQKLGKGEHRLLAKMIGGCMTITIVLYVKATGNWPDILDEHKVQLEELIAEAHKEFKMMQYMNL